MGRAGLPVVHGCGSVVVQNTKSVLVVVSRNVVALDSMYTPEPTVIDCNASIKSVIRSRKKYRFRGHWNGFIKLGAG
jgi:hypothetical protein